MKPAPPHYGYRRGRLQFTEENRMLKLLLRCAAWIHMGQVKIIDRDDLGAPRPLVPRAEQTKMLQIAIKQAIQRKPIRVLAVKLRRYGLSTISEVIIYFAARTNPYRGAMTVAHADDAALEIFKITKIIHGHAHGIASTSSPDRKRHEKRAKASWKISFDDIHSEYQCATAMGRFTASGSTLMYVHMSELAKYPHSTEQDSAAIDSILNSISQTSPETIVIIESSGFGPDGEFPKMARAAEEGNSEYELMFVKWLDDKALAVKDEDVPATWNPPLGGQEIILKEKYGATDNQVAWRRRKIGTRAFGGNNYHETPTRFAWDFPLTLEEALSSATGRCYPMFSRSKHEGVVPDDFPWSEKSYRIRTIDWGESPENPFVVLFVRVDPEKPPQVVVHPKCSNFFNEHIGYKFKPNGDPKDKNDHTCDCWRYLVIGENLNCFAYIYDEIYVTDFSDWSPGHAARLVHERSGWVHPSRGDPGHRQYMDIKLYEPGPNGHKFKTGIADRNRPGTIRDFQWFGIPLVGHGYPDMDSSSSRGEKLDGIARVGTLFAADANYRMKEVNKEEEILKSAIEKLTSPRRKILTPEEEEVWKRWSSRNKTEGKEKAPLMQPAGMSMLARGVNWRS